MHGSIKIRIVFVLLMISIIFCGQAQSFVKIDKDGKQQYVHTVEEGNTIYNLISLYGVAKEDFITYNPGITEELFVGQKVFFPISRQTITHEVQAKETLFSLSKKYGVPIDSIVRKNSFLDNGLKIGQLIKVPDVERKYLINLNGERVDLNPSPQSVVNQTDRTIFLNDSVTEYIVRQNETIYSISKRFMVSVEEIQKRNNLKSVQVSSGQKLLIPLKKSENADVSVREIIDNHEESKDSNLHFAKKELYKIALLLPFFLDKGEGNADYLSNLSTEFFMGAQMALDSLKARGLNAKVYVYDVRNDSLSLKKVLYKPEMQGIDLIVGPLNSDGAEIVAKWCKKNHVRMVCPVAVNAAVLKNNPYVYSAVPSDITLMKKLADFILNQNQLEQLILVKSSLEKDNVLYEAFRSNYLKQAEGKEMALKIVEATLENFSTFIRKGSHVAIVVPSNEKLVAVKFMNSLNDISSKLDPDFITLYGTKEWMTMDDIKASFRNKFAFHFASPNDLNYTYPRTLNLLKKYRSKYKSDLSKFAVQGYDVFAFFCAWLLLDENNEKLVMNRFNMVPLGGANGFENQNGFVLKQSNYELINAE